MIDAVKPGIRCQPNAVARRLAIAGAGVLDWARPSLKVLRVVQIAALILPVFAVIVSGWMRRTFPVEGGKMITPRAA